MSIGMWGDVNMCTCVEGRGEHVHVWGGWADVSEEGNKHKLVNKKIPPLLHNVVEFRSCES